MPEQSDVIRETLKKIKSKMSPERLAAFLQKTEDIVASFPFDVESTDPNEEMPYDDAPFPPMLAAVYGFGIRAMQEGIPGMMSMSEALCGMSEDKEELQGILGYTKNRFASGATIETRTTEITALYNTLCAGRDEFLQEIDEKEKLRQENSFAHIEAAYRIVEIYDRKMIPHDRTPKKLRTYERDQILKQVKMLGDWVLNTCALHDDAMRKQMGHLNDELEHFKDASKLWRSLFVHHRQ